MDTDNASLLTAACALLERYRAEERLLENEMAMQQARLEVLREVISALSGKPRARRGRPAKAEPPQDDTAAIDAFAEAALAS